jgi:hypothetical protein
MCIRHHLCYRKVVVPSADAENPTDLAAGKANKAASVNFLKDRPSKGVGTGDDGHGLGISWLPLYHIRNILHYLGLNPISNAKVVAKNRDKRSKSLDIALLVII